MVQGPRVFVDGLPWFKDMEPFFETRHSDLSRRGPRRDVTPLAARTVRTADPGPGY